MVIIASIPRIGIDLDVGWGGVYSTSNEYRPACYNIRIRSTEAFCTMICWLLIE